MATQLWWTQKRPRSWTTPGSVTCFQGCFDITGVLRRRRRFDQSERLPDAERAWLSPNRIGFEKVRWKAARIILPAGMEIDFGGIGKEYAVDRVLALVTARFAAAALVNFGGDLAANRAPGAAPWQVGSTPQHRTRGASALGAQPGRPCHQWGYAPLPAARRGTLRPHPGCAHRLARAAGAALGDRGCGQQR